MCFIAFMLCYCYITDSIPIALTAIRPSASSSSETADRVRAQQIKEQQEMQLLERRIREAAGQSMIGTHTHTHTSLNSVHDNSNSVKVDRSLQQLEELNRERESEYKTLAARYNADDKKDTVDDAEKNRGVYITTNSFLFSNNLSDFIL